jgi:hypothetical protein
VRIKFKTSELVDHASDSQQLGPLSAAVVDNGTGVDVAPTAAVVVVVLAVVGVVVVGVEAAESVVGTCKK